MISIEKILNEAQKFLSKEECDLICKAYEYAKEIYGDEKTVWNLPLIQNYLVTTHNLLTLHPGVETVCTSLLQRTPLMKPNALEYIRENFGENIHNLVKNASTIIEIDEKNEKKILMNVSNIDNYEMPRDTLRKMFLAMANDLRVLYVRLAQKLTRMQYVHKLNEEIREPFVYQTKEIFVPIANRLGIYQFKRQLEDSCFKYLQPQEYKGIKKQFEDGGKMYENSLKIMEMTILNFLAEHKIKAVVKSRLKGYYSTFTKMHKKNFNSIDKILDLFAIRVILKKQEDCYRVLGLVHNRWQHIPGRFKDYIAAPKVNGYRSLHTCIVGTDKTLISRPVEIQIRTEEMHKEAEFGVAAHWWYKEKETNQRTHARKLEEAKTTFQKNYEEKVQWVKNLIDIKQDERNDEEFASDLKLNLFSDRIFVLTPTGEVKDMPKGSTIVDFAYAVHSDIGNHCMRGKVDGENVPLDHELKNGNTVEIFTGSNKTPNRFWLSFVKTQKAREKIRAWIISLRRDEIIKQGKDILNKHLKNIGQPELDGENLLLRDIDGKRLNVKDREQLLEDVGKEKITAVSLIRKLFPNHELFRRKPTGLKTTAKESSAYSDDASVLIAGETGHQTKMANCCKPKLGEAIVGYITRDGVISIHKWSCKVLKGLNKERYMTANWKNKKAEGTKLVVNVYFTDHRNILYAITNLFRKNGLEIRDFSRKRNNENFTLSLLVEIFDYEDFEKVIQELEELEGIAKVETQQQKEIIS